ncbi:MAG: hypothetical protein VX265_10100 [Myxococcota bacterium]|nr:hypothetical protein [Myxococcota bacterium]
MLLPQLLIAVASAAPTVPDGADAPDRIRRSEAWDAWGEARIRSESAAVPPTAATAEGAWGQTSTRIIAGADGRWMDGRLRLVGELEALNGPLAGPAWTHGLLADPVPFTPPRDGSMTAGFLPRQARIAWKDDRVQASAGLESFAFGSGILANDGKASDDRWFGDAWSGSVMARVRLGTSPWRPDASRGALRGLRFNVLADQVVRDDNAVLARGDLARQVYGAVGFGTPRFRSALFAGRRWQRDFDQQFGDEAIIGPFADPWATTLSLDPEGWTTRVTPVAAWCKVDLLAPDGDHHVGIESEVVHIRGTTTRVYNPETVAAPAEVRSLGGLVRVRWDHDPSRTTARVDAVYASGDNDPRDGVARTFTLHSDFNMGMLLFEQVMPWLGARAADGLADPSLTAVPPAGLRHAIPQGGVHNTMALAPAVRWRPWQPIDLRLGALFARGAGDVIDLDAAARTGGYNIPYAGGSPDQRGLGVELDAGIHGRVPVSGIGALLAGVEGAVLLPGDAIAVPELGTPTLLRARLDLQW